MCCLTEMANASQILRPKPLNGKGNFTSLTLRPEPLDRKGKYKPDLRPESLGGKGKCKPDFKTGAA